MRCPNGTCLTLRERCDGVAQCADGRDEPVTCGKAALFVSFPPCGMDASCCLLFHQLLRCPVNQEMFCFTSSVFKLLFEKGLGKLPL